MSNYTKATNFATKDTLPTGDSNKIVKGTEIDNEFNSVAGAISSKADIASPTFTGIPSAPLATEGSNTTQIATTAYVTAERAATATLTNKTLTSPTLVSPVLGTPASGTLTNCTGLPIVNGTTGTLSVARGGTGTSSPSLVAGTNITISGSFPNQTISTNAVTSLNGQTGAVVTTNYDAIGSVALAANTTASNYLPGQTIAGSSLYRPTTIVSPNFFGVSFGDLPTEGGVSPLPYPYTVFNNLVAYRLTGPSSYTVPGGATALSGTWRALYFSKARQATTDSEQGVTTSLSHISLWVRIS